MQETEKKIIEMFEHGKRAEEQYNEMTKDELINLLVCKDLMENSFEIFGNRANFWYYVGDETGAKYISDEFPKVCKTCLGKEDTFFMTDGEVNIRIPECMEDMFPELKYGDAPVKIELSINYKE